LGNPPTNRWGPDIKSSFAFAGKFKKPNPERLSLRRKAGSVMPPVEGVEFLNLVDLETLGYLHRCAKHHAP
jgi:hypothetical protein